MDFDRPAWDQEFILRPARLSDPEPGRSWQDVKLGFKALRHEGTFEELPQVSPPPCGKRQPATPELPGTIAKPARFGAKHDFDQTVLTNGSFQNNDVVESAKVHRLGDDAGLGVRFIAHRIPPKIFSTKFCNQSLRGIRFLNHNRFSGELPPDCTKRSEDMPIRSLARAC
jgi:hypothetical protein